MENTERAAFNEEVLRRYVNDYGNDNITLAELMCDIVSFTFDFYHASCRMNSKALFFASLEEKVKENYTAAYKNLPAGTVAAVVPIAAELSKYFIEDLIESENNFDSAFGERLDAYTVDCSQKLGEDYAGNPTMNYIAQTIIKVLHYAVIVYVKTFIS